MIFTLYLLIKKYKPELLHSHTFSQVSWLVYIQAFGYADVVAQEL